MDEADHLADLGLLPAVRRLLDATPPAGQRMLFSATLDHAADVLVRRFLDHPAEHAVDPPGLPRRSSTTGSPSPPPTGRQLPPPSPPATTGR